VYYSYIDASGSRLRKDPENFVLTAITIHESQLKYIDKKIYWIKKKELLEYDPNKIELHAKDMTHRYSFFKNIPIAQIYQLLDKTFSFLSEGSADYFTVSTTLQKRKYGKNGAIYVQYRINVSQENIEELRWEGNDKLEFTIKDGNLIYKLVDSK